MAFVACNRFCLAAAVATLADAAVFKRQPTEGAEAHLVAANATSESTEQMLQGVFANFYEYAAVVSLEAEDAKEEQAPGGINMQVPEKELKELLSKLSAKCEKQFSAIIHGQGPKMHMYGAQDSVAGKSPTCVELQGALCTMDAHVKQEKSASGRSMSSTTTVSGKGCLPESCNAGKDLEVLANFMQLKAQDALPGAGVNVHLNVDCSKAGGSIVEVGALQAISSKKPVRAGKMPKGAAEHAMLPSLGALLTVMLAAFSHTA